MSVLTDSGGWWSFDLANARTPDPSSYFRFSETGDLEHISVRIDDNPPIQVSIDTGNDQPSDPIGLGWILNLRDMPWHQNVKPYYTGAAAAQMILDYIRSGAGAVSLSQDDIYAFGHARNQPENSSLEEMDPQALDMALGHFDPYDALVSNNWDWRDSEPGGNPLQGYNFSIYSYDTADPEAFNHYVRDICHWMAFTVTREEWWRAGELVARPHTPTAIPLYGSYSHWVAVQGFIASANPNPEPLTNPWFTPDFTVYGFWIKDPAVTGLGQQKYVTAEEARSTYFKPLETGDRYAGKYVQAAEPPARISRAQVEVYAQPGSKVLLDKTKRLLGAAQKGEKEAQTFDWREVLDPRLAQDPGVATAFKDSYPETPFWVYRPDRKAGDYYLVAFYKQVKTAYWSRPGIRLPQLAGAIILGAQDGKFREASWAEKPIRKRYLTESQAVFLARRQILNEYYERYGWYWKRNLTNPGQMFTVMRKLWEWIGKWPGAARLVWEPDNAYRASVYDPYWEVTLNRYRVYHVTQSGKVYPLKKAYGKK